MRSAMAIPNGDFEAQTDEDFGCDTYQLLSFELSSSDMYRVHKVGCSECGRFLIDKDIYFLKCPPMS